MFSYNKFSLRYQRIRVCLQYAAYNRTEMRRQVRKRSLVENKNSAQTMAHNRETRMHEAIERKGKNSKWKEQSVRKVLQGFSLGSGFSYRQLICCLYSSCSPLLCNTWHCWETHCFHSMVSETMLMQWATTAANNKTVLRFLSFGTKSLRSRYTKTEEHYLPYTCHRV